MIQHAQYVCKTCQKPTLHVRNRYTVPHIGHLVLTLFFAALGIAFPPALLLAGGWLCVWILHGLLNVFTLRRFRCNVCGAAH